MAATAFAVLTASAQSPAPKDPLCEIQTTERVVAIGDVHGAFDRFVAILQEARLIDARQRWIGGRTILVQTGDIVDRGPDSRQALDLLRRLEGQANGKGGRVYALLGNHEIMRIRGEFPYVSAGEYSVFRNGDSEDLRERYYTLLAGRRETEARAAGGTFDEPAYRERFLASTPLGLVEMRRAFLPNGDYGRWLQRHTVMVKINGVVFVHGGTNAGTAAAGCAGINAAARAELKEPTFADSQTPNLLTGPDGPLWFRGLADDPPTLTPDDVDGILRSLAARAIVIGHTVAETVDGRGDRHAAGRIRALFNGSVFQIDTGMIGGAFFPGGQASALEFQGGVITAIYVGDREVLAAPGTTGTPQPPRPVQR